MLNRDIEEDDEENGGVERGVSGFARKMSYLSFAFRIILTVVLWKDSLDFIRIVKARNVDSGSISLE